MDTLRCSTPGCDAAIEWYADRCLACGRDIGFPNVRDVERTEEQEALQLRYDQGLHEAQVRGTYDNVNSFADTIDEKAHAVINVWPSFLYTFSLCFPIYLHGLPTTNRRRITQTSQYER